MNAIVDVVFPVFAVMASGYLFGRFNVLGKAASEVLSNFVYYVALPSLVFLSTARIGPGAFFDLSYLGALGGGMLAVFCGSILIARFAFPNSVTALGLHGLTAMFSSTGYIGIPLLLIAYGDEALVPAIIGAVITGAVFMPLVIIAAEFERAPSGARWSLRPLVRVVISPPVLSAIAGLSVAALGLTLPSFVTTTFDMLGKAYGPCALFSAGLFMVGRTATLAVPEVAWLTVVKLLLHPLITWWLAASVFGLSGVWLAAAIIQAALPSGVPVFVLAQRYGVFVERSNATITLTTVLSVVTLSVVLLLLKA